MKNMHLSKIGLTHNTIWIIVGILIMIGIILLCIFFNVKQKDTDLVLLPQIPRSASFYNSIFV